MHCNCRVYTGPTMNRVLAVILCGFVSACGSSSPATPSAPPTPAPPAPPPPPVVSEFSGAVTATNAGQPLAGISVATSSATVTTDSGGAFSLKINGASTGNFLLTLSGAGVMTHVTRLQWPAHPGIALDAITLAPPFDMTFYRQLARGAYDHDTISALFPWTTNPNIYIRTVDATGRTIEPEVLRWSSIGVVHQSPCGRPASCKRQLSRLARMIDRTPRVGS